MLSTMKTTRWINRSLPQLLYFSSILLYFDAGFGFLGVLSPSIGGSAYFFVQWFLVDNASLNSSVTLTKLIVLIASALYVFAGWGIANEKKVGWMVGVAVSSVAVVLPFVTYGFGIIGTSYIITLAFNIALVALLVHPQSRDYQRIWFH